MNWKKKIPTHTQPKHISSCLCFVTKYYVHEPSSFRIIQLTYNSRKTTWIYTLSELQGQVPPNSSKKFLHWKSSAKRWHTNINVPYLFNYKVVMIIRRGCNRGDPRKKNLSTHTNIRRYRVADELSRLGGDCLKYWITNTAKMKNGNHEIGGEASFNMWVICEFCLNGVASRKCEFLLIGWLHGTTARAAVEPHLKAKFVYKVFCDFGAKNSGKQPRLIFK